MRVALVFNQKKEDTTQKSVSGDVTEPPSLNTYGAQTTSYRTSFHSPTTQTSDLYAEWDTAETIEAVRSALAEIHDVSLIEANDQAYLKLRSDPPDMVFNMAEGLFGVSREAQVPAMLEMLQIRYTGSDPLTLAVCLDKSRTKEILSYHGIATPRFAVVGPDEAAASVDVRLPALVKPLHEGSSKGIYNSCVVRNHQELELEIRKIHESYTEPALVEEYLEGREFTVALLGNGNHLRVLPIVEIKFDSLPAGVNPIYSYEAKWIWDTTDAPLDIYSCPADLTPSLQMDIESLCRRAFTILRCRDWCRIDVRLDAGGNPHVLELNPLPGILPDPRDNSCFPKAARAAGLTYNELLQSVVALAASRYGIVGKRLPYSALA